MLAALLDLLSRIRHALAIFLLFHALPQLVGIAQDLLLLIPEPFELPFDLLLGLSGLGRLERRLQFLEPLVDVRLALGQLAQPIEHLTRLTLLALSLREVLFPGPSRALLFVAVLIRRQLELLKLPLRHSASGAAAALLLAPRVISNHLEFPGAQLEQGLVGSLLGGKSRIERRDRRVVGNVRQAFLGILHQASRLFQAGFRRRILQPLCELVGLLDRRLLSLFQHLAVFGELFGRLGAGLSPHQLPGAVDDLLLKLGQLVGIAGVVLPAFLLLVLGRSARWLLTLAEDLLEVPDLGKEHVARGCAGAARRARRPRPRRNR